MFSSQVGMKRFPNLVFRRVNSILNQQRTCLVFIVAGSDYGVFGLLAGLGGRQSAGLFISHVLP